MQGNFLNEVAVKCNITDAKTLRKASELIKLIATQKSVNCSESCKTVVCLELAGALVGVESVKRENAIKYSGCKPSLYVNMFNIISKILNLDRIYSVKELCLKLGVSEMESQAVKLLQKYQNKEFKSNEDLEHPMYPCAAILAACKINNMKISASKFVELSRLKKNELEDLTDCFMMLNKTEPRSKALKSEAEPIITNGVSKTPKKSRKIVVEDEEAEYQNWKKMMLNEEYLAE